ncbi:MAG: hypothetical protein DRG24_04490 [Epsilonproteobacteria bacterium]|nr:MAG: hypothetical protein DRG24_04490 [Campylobacterota bacterium]
MKVKQYSIKVFELTIESESSFLDFMEKNLILLKRYLIVLKGVVTPPINEYLDKNDISYTTNLNINNDTHQEQVIKQSDLKIIDTIVRSGQELKVNSDLLILNRINSGAKLHVEGNMIVTDIVDGLIVCNGDFMLIKTSSKALIIFNGVEIEGALLKNKFHKIRFNGEEVTITPIEKEPKWA